MRDQEAPACRLPREADGAVAMAVNIGGEWPMECRPDIPGDAASKE
jgi:hypothetical protein